MKKTYYLYHIPGIKIGMTTNLINRVEKEQGYKKGEYNIVASSDDLDLMSNLELKLQELFNYKVDRDPYNKLFNNMKVTSTEWTSTFSVPLNKLKGNLMDNIGLQWDTPNGYSFVINNETIKWIVENAKTSMYTDTRCYVYNKAMKEAFDEKSETSAENNMFKNIREWAKERGLYEKGDVKTQFVKLQEEAGEVARAIIKKDDKELKDGIGDMVVVLTNLAHLAGFTIEECIEEAYNVIKNRKGSMKNGSFVKNTL